MSVHASVTTEIKNEHVLGRTCAKLGVAAPKHVTDAYAGGGSKVTGVQVQFPSRHGSRANAVIELKTGVAHYDSDYAHDFPKFADAYSIEMIKYMAEQQGQSFREFTTTEGEAAVEVFV